MRLVEFASAEDQMALWKLISDNVWSAINQQARDEAARKAARRAAKPKGGKRRTKGGTPSRHIPPLPPPKKAEPPLPLQQKAAAGAQQLPTRVATQQQLPAHPIQLTALPKPIPSAQPSAAIASAQPQALPANPLKAPKRVGFSARTTASAKTW